MKRYRVWAYGMIVSVVLVAVAMAGENVVTTDQQPAQDEEQVVDQGGTAVESAVSPAQRENFMRREEARQRRDAALKARAATIQAAGQADGGGQ